jgi:hypothetical protein
MDWPSSIVAEAGETVAAKGGLTVAVTVAQELAAGVPVLPSVTSTE